jgi:hypothetical protein
MGKLVLIHSKDENMAFNDFIEALATAYKENRLRTMICIAGVNYPEGKKERGFVNTITDYWFSKDGNCSESIGLLEVMKAKILSYMTDSDPN